MHASSFFTGKHGLFLLHLFCRRHTRGLWRRKPKDKKENKQSRKSKAKRKDRWKCQRLEENVDTSEMVGERNYEFKSAIQKQTKLKFILLGSWFCMYILIIHMKWISSVPGIQSKMQHPDSSHSDWLLQPLTYGEASTRAPNAATATNAARRRSKVYLIS